MACLHSFACLIADEMLVLFICFSGFFFPLHMLWCQHEKLTAMLKVC